MVYSPLVVSTVVHVQGSSASNEDTYLLVEQQGLYAVVDGATSLVPYCGPNGESGGLAAARLVTEVLGHYAGQGANDPLPLVAVLKLANDELRTAMTAAGIDVSRPEERWGACVAAVRLHADYLEVAQIGDAVLALVQADGSVTLATPNQLVGVSRITRERCREANERVFSCANERHAFIREGLLANRQLANTQGGYGVLNGQPEAESFICSRRIRRESVQALLLMTDGLAFPGTEHEDGLGIPEVIAHVQLMGLASYAQWLLEQEQEDRACLRFPRAKVSDDKTGIWLSFVAPNVCR
ncbi:MAG: protein phosphatase 2C domain-containing protein [Selenomonadales bacterium]|nr:protein phosphatase 2C domain-containing protein [Selenomonadales bacterium]